MIVGIAIIAVVIVIVIVMIVIIVLIVVTESSFEHSEPQSFYRTNFPSLFVVFRSPLEVEFYPQPQFFYRTNYLWPLTGH